MRRRLIIVLGMLIILGNIQVAFAQNTLQGDSCTIASGDHITGDVFVLCRTLVVSGEIDGNLTGAAWTAQIDGTVDGSLNLAGAQLDISGKIGKDVHFAGGVITLKPAAQLLGARSDLTSISLSTEIDTARIPGSVTSVSYQLLLNGPVSHEVNFWGSALTVNGDISGDVSAQVGDPTSTGVTELSTLFNFLRIDITLINPGLRVTQSATIAGQLRYSGPVAGEIATHLRHPAQFTQTKTANDIIAPSKSFWASLRDYLAQAVREFVGLALIGLLAVLLTRRALQAPIYSLRVRPLPSLGVGLLTFMISFPIFFIVVPLLGALLVLLLTVLQLSDLALIAAAIVFVLDLGGMGLFYFTAIFISRAIVCIALGRFLVRLFSRQRSESYMIYVCMLIGAIVLALLSALPYVGLIFNALAAFLGLGAILTLVQEQLERARDVVVVTSTPTLPEEARQLPPPAIEDRLVGPGMDNLPDGFHWWT